MGPSQIKKRKVLVDKSNCSDSDFEDDNSQIETSAAPIKKSTRKRATKKNSNKKLPNDENTNPTGHLSSLPPPDLIQKINSRRIIHNHNINNNLLSLLHCRTSGSRGQGGILQAVAGPVVEQLSRYRVSHLVTPFESRVTALAWHPGQRYLAAVGSKWGDLILWDLGDRGEGGGQPFRAVIKGRGPGGSIQSVKFDEQEPGRVFTATIDGFVARQDFSRGEEGRKVYLATNDWEKWYTGLDVSFSGKMVVAGNNSGHVTLLSLEGEKVWQRKLHKSKCNFVQFSDRQPWLMVTTSTGGGGGSVKVWDIRNIQGPESALAELNHDKAVNNAVFSPLSGDKLLTTDQHSQLRVYQAPTWRLLRTIHHPHRQFQHLTPIKAAWHPLADLVFAGRYPDPNFPSYETGEKRSIDFFCPESGRLLHKLHQPGLEKIVSLSAFNPAGDCLLSGAASSVVMWQARPGEDGDGEGGGDGKACSRTEGEVQYWPDFITKKKKKVLTEKKVKTNKS